MTNDTNRVIVELGTVIKNRNNYSDQARYFKDNVVQYEGGSYIAQPTSSVNDGVLDGKYYLTRAPFTTNPQVPSAGWSIFATGKHNFGSGEDIEDISIATNADFVNPDSTSRAKVPTVGTILDGMNDGIYDISSRYPTGGPNNDGVFTLEYILSNANTLIPTAWRKGGMSIKFVQSYDNKYVQYRYMETDAATAATFADVANWQGVDRDVTVNSRNLVESNGVFESYILSKEIIDLSEISTVPGVISISTNKWYINGESYLGKFIPITAGKSYKITVINEIAIFAFLKSNTVVNGRAVNYATGETRITLSGGMDSFIHTAPDDATYLWVLISGDGEDTTPQVISLGKTVQEVLQNVDDEPTVESDNLVKSGGVFKELNSASIDVTIPSEETKWLIRDGLWYQTTGNNYRSKTVTIEPGKSYKIITDNATSYTVLNTYNPVAGDAVNFAAGYTHELSVNTNTTFISPENGNILFIFSKYGGNVVSIEVSEYVNRIDKLEHALGDLITTHEIVEDVDDRLEIKIDQEYKIVSYRDKDGVLHENVGIALSEQGMSDFQKALDRYGYVPATAGNFTDKDVIELPEPTSYALMNLIVPSLPLSDSDVSKGYAEYYDKCGNYFKLKCELTAQGQTSRIFAATGGKGNYTLDLEKDVKFGSWVPQDSFHLKGCAKDVMRGILSTSYKWAFMMQEYLNARPNRVLIHEENITTTDATGDRLTDWPTDARCLPDGFPCEIYINGEYWGLYALQLKKHRKNYSMNKKDYESFFLDADAMMSSNYTTGIWNEGPKRWWNSFDIKNPKDMILVDGSDYDESGELISAKISTFDSTNWKYTDDYSTTEPSSDIWNAETSYAINSTCWCYDEEIEWWRKFMAIRANQNSKPLSFETNPVYDSTNKKHVGSAKTKAAIQSFAKKYLEVKALVASGDTINAKAKFNEYFDYNACMLVYIFNCMMGNRDSVKKNTLWGTYSNGKIAPMLWDLDGMYGQGWVGNSAAAPSAELWNGSYATANWPLSLFWQLYETEIKAIYCSLRHDGIISIDAWKSIVFGWVNRVGVEAYERDINKWLETPSYRKNYTNTDYWTEVGLVDSVGNVPLWNAETQYSTGNQVLIRCHSITGYYMVWMKYVAVQDNTNVCPVTQFYTEFPIVGGFFDSPKRMEKWMTSQIELCDELLNYSE